MLPAAGGIGTGGVGVGGVGAFLGLFAGSVAGCTHATGGGCAVLICSCISQ
jgi:hypothetical protein